MELKGTPLSSLNLPGLALENDFWRGGEKMKD